VVEKAGEDPYVLPKFLLNPRSSWTGNMANPQIIATCASASYGFVAREIGT